LSKWSNLKTHKKKGLVLKRGPKKNDAWKVRWVVLDQKTVRYYKDEHDKEQLGMFELERVTNFWSNGNKNTPPKEAPADLGHKLIFSLDVIDNGIREFVFCALSEADKYHWMQAFERNLAGVTKVFVPLSIVFVSLFSQSYVLGWCSASWRCAYVSSSRLWSVSEWSSCLGCCRLSPLSRNVSDGAARSSPAACLVSHQRQQQQFCSYCCSASRAQSPLVRRRMGRSKSPSLRKKPAARSAASAPRHPSTATG
jgi:hypothetical protein